MTTLSWPQSLPQRFNRDGYAEAPGENVLRETMDTGPAKTRLRGTSAPTRVTGQMVMDDDQLRLFKEFYQSSLFYGVVPFSMPDQLGTVRSMTIVEPPSYATRSDSLLTSVTLALEYIP